MEHNHLILDSGTLALERVASMGIFHGKLRSSCWLAEVIFVHGQLELGIFVYNFSVNSPGVVQDLLRLPEVASGIFSCPS